MAVTNQEYDLGLLMRVREGMDNRAKEELVMKYLPMVKHIVRNQLTSCLEFDDLAQEGLIGLLRAIDEYDDGKYEIKFSTFAYICILRKVFNAIKQYYSSKNKPLNNAMSLYAYTSPDESRVLIDLLGIDSTDPLEVVEDQWISERLDRVLRVYLSRVEYSVMSMILTGMSSGEIQGALGLEPKVIDNARTRARLKLRRLVERYGSLLDPDVPLKARKRMDLAMSLPMH